MTDPGAGIIGVVDSDYQIEPGFLRRCAPAFADPWIGFVQSPQDYRGWQEAPYYRRLYYSYKYFFAVSQPARNEHDGAIFAGTMGLIRRVALEQLGGWDEWCITEDAELSLRLLRAGWTGWHVGESWGRPYETFAANSLGTLNLLQSVVDLEIVGLTVQTDAAITGTGYTITVGFGASVIQEVLDSLYVDELIGRDPHDVREIWQQLYYGKAHWIGRAGATTMAQAAVDIALWDIIAKAAGRPLWQQLGGGRRSDIPVYNSHAGWLNYSIDQLKDEALRLLERGYSALKMKVGLADTHEDYRRVQAVRRAIGDDTVLMVDANQKWDLMQASFAARRFEDLGLAWLEEPLHPDDIGAHCTLKERTSIPIALGEHVYTSYAFRDYLDNGAVDVIQVDVCRVGGITPWLEVAAMAHAHGIRVCPHCGDLMQVHQHLVKAIPNSWYLEVIPLWDVGPFERQVRIADGKCLTPTDPGASTDLTALALQTYRVS